MSDNPTSGEWTADYVMRSLAMMDKVCAQVIATAHNAALAAERKRGDEALDWARNIQQDLRETKEQLAADRGKVQTLVKLLEQRLGTGTDWDWNNRVKLAIEAAIEIRDKEWRLEFQRNLLKSESR